MVLHTKNGPAWACSQWNNMTYEHKTKPLLSKPEYILRLAKHFLFSVGLLAISLGIGIIGYHTLGNLTWIDSLLNASMILGGMGPVNEITTNSGKIFASCYALFSGIVFVASAGILIAPVFHRFLHKFHIQDK